MDGVDGTGDAVASAGAVDEGDGMPLDEQPAITKTRGRRAWRRDIVILR
jgi:hypothetical protein